MCEINILKTLAQICFQTGQFFCRKKRKKKKISCPFCRQRTCEKVYGKLQLKNGRLEVRVNVDSEHFQTFGPRVLGGL